MLAGPFDARHAPFWTTEAGSSAPSLRGDGVGGGASVEIGRDRSRQNWKRVVGWAPREVSLSKGCGSLARVKRIVGTPARTIHGGSVGGAGEGGGAVAVPSGAVRFTSRPYRKLDFFEQDRSSIGSVVRVPRSRRSSAMWTLARVSLIATSVVTADRKITLFSGLYAGRIPGIGIL